MIQKWGFSGGGFKAPHSHIVPMKPHIGLHDTLLLKHYMPHLAKDPTQASADGKAQQALFCPLKEECLG